MDIFKKLLGKKSRTSNKNLEQKGTYSDFMTSEWSNAPKLNQNQTVEFSKKMSEVKAMINTISNTVAQAEPKLYRNVEGRKQPVINSDLLDLMRFGNPLIPSGFDLLYSIQYYIDTYGEAFLLIERDVTTKLPKYLYIINSKDMKDLPKKSNDYKYRFVLNGQTYNSPLTEIIHIKIPNVDDIYGRGIGTISALLDTMQIVDYTEEYTKNFFYNNAIPPYIINAQDVGKQQLKEFKKEWINEHGGMFEQHKPYFLSSSNVQAIKLQAEFNIGDLDKLSKMSSEKIQLAFGIPNTILGKSSENRASGQNDFEVYAQFCIKPRLKRIYETLNLTLVKEFGDDLVLEFTNPVPSDNEKIFRAMQLDPTSFLKNELRALIGYDFDYELDGQYMEGKNVKEKDKMPLIRSDNPKSDEDIRRENE